MDRLNPLGIPRRDLTIALKRSDWVQVARETNQCMLCCQSPVNEAGICELCVVKCNDEELRLVELWCAGVEP